MPLYHSAGMHVFSLPYLAVGATIRLLEAPTVPDILRYVEERADRRRCSSPRPSGCRWPTIPTSTHRDLSALRKALLRRLDHAGDGPESAARALPRPRFLQLLRAVRDRPARAPCCGPRSTNSGQRRAGGRCSSSRRGSSTPTETTCPTANRARCCTARRSCAAATGTTPRRRRRPSGTAGSTPATSSRATREGYITVVDRIKDVINTGGVLVASREVEDALYTHPDVAEVAVIGMPDERWIEAINAVVVPREATAPGGRNSSRTCASKLGGVQGAQAGHVRRRAAAQPERKAAEAGAAEVIIAGSTA